MKVRAGRSAMGIAFVACIGWATVSCGLPQQDAAQVLDDIPDDVLATVETVEPVSEQEEEDAPFQLVLYWHEGDQGRLVRVDRPVNEAPTVQTAIDQLIGGPTNEEIAETPGVLSMQANAGLTDPELAPVVSDPVDGVVTITVGGTGFRELPNKTNAAAELVCTLTEFPAVAGVLVFDAQPEPINLVGINSESIEGPASRADFADCETLDTGEPTADDQDTDQATTSTTTG